ncbi:MAG: HEAT repeat domain-containing protein [Bryobacteraceae bacterium]
MRTQEQRLLEGLQRELQGRHKQELEDQVTRRQESGLALQEALYDIVKTPGTGPYVRGGAAAALLSAGCLDCVDMLLEDFFGGADDESIWEAAQSLEQACAKRAVEPLRRALYDANPTRRRVAAHVLGWLEDSRAVAPLVRSLEDPNQIEVVRGQCAESLGYLGSGQAIPALIRSLKDPSVEVRFWSVFALGAAKAPPWGTVKGSRVKAALESMLGDPAVLPSMWPVGQEALAMLAEGLPRGNRYERRVRTQIAAIRKAADASPEDRSWAEWYGR